jgi:hypothetical protein
MIRIDEIYNNTFWPWIQQHLPEYRMFFCDPPGNTDPSGIFNYGNDNTVEKNFIFFHDQEPVHLDQYQTLFDEICRRVCDILWRINCNSEQTQTQTLEQEEIHNWSHRLSETKTFPQLLQKCNLIRPTGHIVVSEQGEYVEKLCEQYGWQSHYYFYHGWACQDWFRGYDKTFLIPRAKNRHPTRTFMSPNRIVGGMRDHRVLFLYNVFKQDLEDNHISVPRICPAENVDITSIAQKYANVYQDIATVFDQTKLPRMFTGESTQEMTSCWLTNFSEAADSLVYVPTETVYFGKRLHLTEKTFKAIALEMPFVLVAPAGSLEYLRSYGFKTFAGIFDESYDEETDDILRIERVTKLLKELNDLSVTERQKIHQACLPIVEHNFEHFYGQGFSNILWDELLNMLKGLRV